MMRSLFAGVSGLKNHQTKMDIIGNNIANVNTVGFKKSRVTFQDMLSQTLRGSSSPQSNQGGTNAMQVGLGMSLASIDTIMTSGSPQSTGKNTDLSIEGEGFFILGDGTDKYYTRAGNFDFDYNKNFINSSNGMLVQGILADANGDINSKGTITNINLASQVSSPPKATTSISYNKNLDFTATVNSGSLADVSHDQGTTNTVSLGASTLPLKSVSITGLTEGTDYNVNYQTGEVTFTNSTTALSGGITETTSPAVAHVDGTPDDITLTGNKPYSNIVVKKNGTTITSGYTVDTVNNKVTILAGTGTAGNYTVTYDTQPYTIDYTTINYATPMTVYDSKGDTHQATVYYSKTATPNTWSVDTQLDGTLNRNAGTITFDPTTGKMKTSTVPSLTATISGANDLNLAFDFTNVTEYAGDFTVVANSQDGYAAGDLKSVSVDTSGVITGGFSNGQNRKLAQLAIATFSNPGGLTKSGNNLFQTSNNSGEADAGVPGISGRGIIKPETLEMSNVDLSQEFVDMIITQRGFQANSRVITTSDQILEELVNLRR